MAVKYGTMKTVVTGLTVVLASGKIELEQEIFSYWMNQNLFITYSREYNECCMSIS